MKQFDIYWDYLTSRAKSNLVISGYIHDIDDDSFPIATIYQEAEGEDAD